MYQWSMFLLADIGSIFVCGMDGVMLYSSGGLSSICSILYRSQTSIY